MSDPRRIVSNMSSNPAAVDALDRALEVLAIAVRLAQLMDTESAVPQ